eukprot:5585333-Pyramimonas_sp.AAC.1
MRAEKPPDASTGRLNVKYTFEIAADYCTLMDAQNGIGKPTLARPRHPCPALIRRLTRYTCKRASCANGSRATAV